MKNIFFALLIPLFLFGGCEKFKEPGDLKITVSYYYNDFIGYKPDVGATATLFEDETLRYDDYIEAAIGAIRLNEDDLLFPDYKAEADVNGIITIYDLPVGEYYLAIVSEGRFTYSEKVITIPSGGALDLVKNFYYLHPFERENW